MRHFVFSEIWIDLIQILTSNNWYYININGVRHGFLKSSRGLKQGNPLSPSLFIIGAELLSRMMHHLPIDNFILFSADTWSQMITHLSFVDDTILFSSGDIVSISMIMKKLELYELVSRQLVNKTKSSFLVSPNTLLGIIDDIRLITGNSQSHFPFTYLGCPIFLGRKKIEYFGNMVATLEPF